MTTFGVARCYDPLRLAAWHAQKQVLPQRCERPGAGRLGGVDMTQANWKWYCRIDGTKGEHPTRQQRDDAALQHRDHDCRAAHGRTPCWAEAGHLVHVWRY